MSTRSYICKEIPDGKYYGIYCHWDGYLSHNGKILVNHYMDAQKVDELLALGDLSTLAENICPNPVFPHNISKSQDGVCVAYARDGGENIDDTQAKFITLEEASESWADYMYIFGQDGIWRYFDLSSPEFGLRNVMDYLDNEILISKVNAELYQFKKNIMQKQPIEIYNEAGKIRFYEYMTDYINYEEIGADESKILHKSSENLLADLWNTMLDLEDFNIGNSDDAAFLLETYISNCSKKIAQM